MRWVVQGAIVLAGIVFARSGEADRYFYWDGPASRFLLECACVPRAEGCPEAGDEMYGPLAGANYPMSGLHHSGKEPSYFYVKIEISPANAESDLGYRVRRVLFRTGVNLLD